MDLGRHLAGGGAGQAAQQRDDGGPDAARGLGHSDGGPGGEVAAAGRERLAERGRGGRADAGHEAQHAQARHGVARVLGQAQKGDEVFDVGRLDEAQAAVLAKGDVAPGELDLEQQRMVLGAKQHRLAVSGVPCSRCSRMRSASHAVCSSSSRQVTSSGRAPPARSVQSTLSRRSAASAMTALVAARMGAVER